MSPIPAPWKLRRAHALALLLAAGLAVTRIGDAWAATPSPLQLPMAFEVNRGQSDARVKFSPAAQATRCFSAAPRRCWRSRGGGGEQFH